MSDREDEEVEVRDSRAAQMQELESVVDKVNAMTPAQRAQILVGDLVALSMEMGLGAYDVITRGNGEDGPPVAGVFVTLGPEYTQDTLAKWKELQVKWQEDRGDG